MPHTLWFPETKELGRDVGWSCLSPFLGRILPEPTYRAVTGTTVGGIS